MNTRRSRFSRLSVPALFGAAILVAAVAGEVARAQPSSARDKAVDLAQAGQDALDKQDFATALDKFKEADGLVHAPTLLLGVARAEVGLHHLVLAQEAYKRIVHEGNPDPKKQVFVDALKNAQAELDALTPRVPTVLIAVRGGTASALTLDGAPLDPGVVGSKTPVDAGKHHVHATTSAGASADADVSLAEGANETVTLDLIPTGATAPAQKGGPESESRGVGLSPQRIAGISLIAVGGAALIMGAATGGLALSKHRDLSSACPGGKCVTASAQSELGSYHVMGALSTVGFVVGAAAAGTGIVVFATAPSAKANATARVTPSIGLGYAALDVAF